DRMAHVDRHAARQLQRTVRLADDVDPEGRTRCCRRARNRHQRERVQHVEDAEERRDDRVGQSHEAHVARHRQRRRRRGRDHGSLFSQERGPTPVSRPWHEPTDRGRFRLCRCGSPATIIWIPIGGNHGKEQDTMDAPVIDRTKLDAFVSRAIEDLSAGYGGVMVSLGDKLGLYKALWNAGPSTSGELADRAGCSERYVREWLNAQVAGGYVDYHASSQTYELSPEQAAVLADEDSPLFIPNAWNVPASMWFDEPQAIEAFRTGNGVAWGLHDGRLHCGSAAFYRNAYRSSLVDEWLPSLDGV